MTDEQVEYSILIPYREDGGQRDRLKAWQSLRFMLMPIDGRWEVIYGLCDPDRPFNRSEAINDAFYHSNGEKLLIMDSDTVWDWDVLSNAIDILKMGSWGFPYCRYHILDGASTHRLYESSHGVYIGGLHLTDELMTHTAQFNDHPLSGLLAISKTDFLATGGFEESFEGWGYEDDAFIFNAERVLGPGTRANGDIYHMAHPRTKAMEMDSVTATTNRARFELYVRDYPLRKMSWV